MQAHTIGDLEELDPVRKRRYEILQEIVDNHVLSLADHYNLEIAIMFENQDENEPIYEKHKRWGMGVLKLEKNYAEITISDKAARDLSDVAFEAMVYHEIAEMFMLRLAAERFPLLVLAEINGEIPYSQKEAAVDLMARNFFKTKGLVPFRVEAANIDYREGHLNIEYFQEYLSELGKLLPQIAEEIRQKLDFKDKL